MTGIVAIEPEWLSLFARSHVTLSKPRAEPPPYYDEEKDKVGSSSLVLRITEWLNTRQHKTAFQMAKANSMKPKQSISNFNIDWTV